jgi:hypothetical protein
MRAQGHIVVVIAFMLSAIIPVSCIAQTLNYERSEKYPLSDYQTHGMVFLKQHQPSVEDLTSKLLKHEREYGYFGGHIQEETIRAKLKIYFALATGVHSGTGNETDDSTHRAVKITNDYFRDWFSKMPEVKNKDAVKALAAKHYKAALEFEQERARGNDLKKAERAERLGQEAEARIKERHEWEARVERENALKALKDAQNDAEKVKKEACKGMCAQSHRKNALMFFKCMKACKKYE